MTAAIALFSRIIEDQREERDGPVPNAMPLTLHRSGFNFKSISISRHTDLTVSTGVDGRTGCHELLDGRCDISFPPGSTVQRHFRMWILIGFGLRARHLISGFCKLKALNRDFQNQK